MSTTDWLYVGIKLLGLYFICIAVIEVPTALGYIGLSVAEEIESETSTLAIYLLSSIAFFVVGLFLAFRANFIQSLLLKEKTSSLSDNSFSMGGVMKLLGVFLVINSIAEITSNVGLSITSESSLLVQVSLYGPSTVTFLLGIMLVYKGQYLWDLISE